MTARQWTREGLDVAHPEVKAAGWAWELWDSGATPVAVAPGRSRWVVIIDDRVVCADEGGDLYRPLAPIAEAVILASRGLDSLGAMAAECERMSVESSDEATLQDREGEHTEAVYFRGRATGARLCAAMLRSGKVNP